MRRCGREALALPPMLAAVLGVALVALGGGPAAQVAAVDTVPLGAGLAAVAALGRERMIEVQLTVRTPYRLTVARRVTLVLAAACGAVLVLGLLGRGVVQDSAGALLTGNIVFASALIGLPTYAIVEFRSTAGASVLVMAAWLAKLLVMDQFAVVAESLVLLTVAALCAWLAALRITDSEAQLRGVRG
ncbi:hypothetical protein GCM10009764_84930 [Nocardia ninae]|uniref:Uncharacterized protein n=2 Tax=Nocardia ninae TaxID=356145 RepID=A0A511M8W8_9NOCA|nr:hypothetical protein NN4_16010 [Nocardia ninae NBRC 108245]